jgi:hypothetical protein
MASSRTEINNPPPKWILAMALVMSSLGTAAVAAIYMVYGAYRDYIQVRLQREGVLRERVAFLLWTLADRMTADTGEIRDPLSDVCGGNLGSHRLRLL